MSKINKLFAGVAAGAVLAFAGAASATQGVTDTEVVVADILPMSGPPAMLGIAHNIGVKIAVAEANAKGGINGRKVRLISKDDAYVPSRTIQALREALTVDRVFALTSISGAAQGLTALPMIARAGIPAITTISFTPAMYEPVTKNVFAIGTTYPEAVTAAMGALDELYPGKKWGVVTQDDEYGASSRIGIEQIEKERNLDIVYRAIYRKGQRDFSSEMLRFKDAGGELLYAGGVISEPAAMLRALEQMNYQVPVAVPFVTRVPAFLSLAGSAVGELYAVDYVEPEGSERGKAFLEKAAKLVSASEVQLINRYTFTGYAGARVLFEAMERCGKDLTWECTISQLEGMKNFDTGVMAPVSFSSDSHFANQPLTVMKADAESGAYMPVE